MKLIPCYLFLTLALISNSAHAYIDPGSGSFILQMCIATFIGAFFSIKMYFNKIKEKIRSFLGYTNKSENINKQDKLPIED